MLTLKLKPGKDKPVKLRHPWIFSGALEKIPDKVEAGTPVKILGADGEFLGQGYFNSYSQIAVRLWSFDAEERINHDFFVKRIRAALALRQDYLGSETDSYRLVNSENDFLPGLIVDKYANYLVVQFHTRGIESWKSEIINSLLAVLNPTGIFENSASLSRRVEKLEEQKGVLFGEIPDKIIITENGLKFYVDVQEGQKTGFFLDQRDKRWALMKYAKDKNVLNCFAYTGGFSVYALAAGAKSVVSVDSSAPAIALARENMQLNGLNLKQCEFIVADAKSYLKTCQPGKFETIVLDPPAFIKDRHKIKEGIKGYRGISAAALKIIAANGILLTCSCSNHLSLEQHKFILAEAGSSAAKNPQIIETFLHGVDHPSLSPFTESDYLKCIIARIVV